MSGVEIARPVLSSADDLLKTLYALQVLLKLLEVRQVLRTLVSESKVHVERMRASIVQYSHGVPENSIPRQVLKKARVQFDDINRELEALLETRHITFKLRTNK